MGAASRSGHRSVVKPVMVVFGAIVLFIYGTVALLSQDARWFLSRADVPDAQRIVDIGLPNLLRISLFGEEVSIFKFDRLLRGRTMFLADNTLNPLGIRQTTIFIKPGVTDLELMLGG